MQEPNSPEEVFALHKLRRADPRLFLEIVNERLRENPRNFRAYFRRHFAWADMGEPRRALADLDRVIELAPTPAAFCARGAVNRDLGAYENALADFRRGEAMNPKEWEDAAITLLYEADTHARLGDEAAALSCCARLPDDFWTPGLNGAPGGGKAEIAAMLRRIAADTGRENLPGADG
jgi:tetratricopeptide (TPR) repeat protein